VVAKEAAKKEENVNGRKKRMEKRLNFGQLSSMISSLSMHGIYLYL
jgi:hypothetical protein